VNKEIKEEDMVCPACGKSDFKEERAIEVGNIFKLQDKFSQPFKLTYKKEDGTEAPVLMGCYGIGISRLLGTIAEVSSDEAGLIWPEKVAPARLHIVDLTRDEANLSVASALYEEALGAGVTALLDDRVGVSAGAKLADADLLGMPIRVVVSDRNLASGMLEVKKRNEQESSLIPLSSFASTCLS
jgi:prolyl-tRNA synthetase